MRSPRNNPKNSPFELTTREQEVLELSKQGKDHKEIAAMLGADPGNIRKALMSAKEKLACQEI